MAHLGPPVLWSQPRASHIRASKLTKSRVRESLRHQRHLLIPALLLTRFRGPTGWVNVPGNNNADHQELDEPAKDGSDWRHFRVYVYSFISSKLALANLGRSN